MNLPALGGVAGLGVEAGGGDLVDGIVPVEVVGGVGVQAGDGDGQEQGHGFGAGGGAAYDLGQFIVKIGVDADGEGVAIEVDDAGDGDAVVGAVAGEGVHGAVWAVGLGAGGVKGVKWVGKIAGFFAWVAPKAVVVEIDLIVGIDQLVAVIEWIGEGA